MLEASGQLHRGETWVKRYADHDCIAGATAGTRRRLYAVSSTGPSQCLWIR
jgi:hypothetical protein